jgi:hypothetical protein
MRSGIWAGACFGANIALLLTQLQGNAAEATSNSKSPTTTQIVSFPGTECSAVKIVRGSAPAKDKDAQKPVAEKAEIGEIVTFVDPASTPVGVLRGETDRAAVCRDGRIPPTAWIWKRSPSPIPEIGR